MPEVKIKRSLFLFCSLNSNVISHKGVCMPIDNCEFSFSELATAKLPTHMRTMTEALKTSYGMSLFSQNGVGKTAVLKKIGLSQDFQGCYVFVDETAPVYV